MKERQKNRLTDEDTAPHEENREPSVHGRLEGEKGKEGISEGSGLSRRP